jgi:hypothetical protein
MSEAGPGRTAPSARTSAAAQHPGHAAHQARRAARGGASATAPPPGPRP